MTPEGFNRVANAVHDGTRATCRRQGCTCHAQIAVTFTQAGAVQAIETRHHEDCGMGDIESIHGVRIVGVYLRGDPCLN